ncbi:MAG: transglutaminase-like domain-containing protein [Clostridia bacterium]|nr:transglutaminase-like domain-containing protein [Clostridia bacterium]
MDEERLIRGAARPWALGVAERDVAAHVAHMLRVRREFAYQRDIPLELFIEYALPMRAGDEPPVRCAELFYAQLAPALRNMPLAEAATLTNYYCMANVTYKYNDAPTRDVLSVFTGGHGRCGEESAFAVMAYRAVGIPCRQVYAKRWSHCEDNHAWIECYTGDGWSYAGACEARDALNAGWFDAAASRAQYIRALTYGEGDAYIEREGAMGAVNVTSRYAATSTLRVRAMRGAQPAPYARLHVELFNSGAMRRLLTLACDRDGWAEAELGRGDVFLCSYSHEGLCMKQVDLSRDCEVSFDLHDYIPDGEYCFTQRAARASVVQAAPPAETRMAGIAHARRRLLHPERTAPWKRPPSAVPAGSCELTLDLSFSPITAQGGNLSLERITDCGTEPVELDLRTPALKLEPGRYRVNAMRRSASGDLKLRSQLLTLRRDMRVALSLPERAAVERLDVELPMAIDGRKIVVACGGEDEPSAHVERELMERRPLLISRGITVERLQPARDELHALRAAFALEGDSLPVTFAAEGGRGRLALCGYFAGGVELLINALEDDT